MEKELLAFCRSQTGLVDGRNAQGGEQGNNTSVPAAIDATFEEAAWDLDDWERIYCGTNTTKKFF